MELAVDLATLALYDIIIYAGRHLAFSESQKGRHGGLDQMTIWLLFLRRSACACFPWTHCVL